MWYDENWRHIVDSIIKLIDYLHHVFLEIYLEHTDAWYISSSAFAGAVTSHVHSMEIVTQLWKVFCQVCVSSTIICKIMKIKHDSLIFWVYYRYSSRPSVILNIYFATLIVWDQLINLEVDWIYLRPKCIVPINEVFIVSILIIIPRNK